MKIKLTQHWHYLVTLLSLVVVNGLMPSIFIIRAIFGFLFIILILMWIGFATRKKETPKDEKNQTP